MLAHPPTGIERPTAYGGQELTGDVHRGKAAAGKDGDREETRAAAKAERAAAAGQYRAMM